MKGILPRSFYNPVTLLGLAIAAMAVGLIVFLFLVDTIAHHKSPYLGLITFVILPGVLLFGVALMLGGVVREHRLERAGKPTELALPRIDLADPRHRSALMVAASGSFLLLATIGFVSYQGFEYTESVRFCGTLCHQVMKPEYAAYKNSPHARVRCVECHIGTGSSWYVRSKVSGARQVFATILDKYPRPVPTPIENLRPARETCETCHWPRYFVGGKLRTHIYYLPDKNNTRYRLDLLVKTGGGATDHGPSYGIHWHMNINNQITYAAIDRERTMIPWIKVRSNGGKERIYRGTEIAASEEQLQKTEQRLMDCIDCHNRPTHIYYHPAHSVNLAMSQGEISPKLPEIRNIAVATLEKPYKSEAAARKGIRRSLEEFYRTKYPEVYSGRNRDIKRAVARIERIYHRNYFPEMRVSWKAYPDNIGHMYAPGCFRCHDGKHVSDDGKVLSKECNSCHTLHAQQLGDEPLRHSPVGLQFRHPVEIGDAWMHTNCSDCHANR